MKIHPVTQGSPEWLALRARCDCASEAPAMMGASSNLTRSELLRLKATGAEREFTEWVQRNLLDKGHAVEALARPIVEEQLGEELYPITITDDEETLLASLDGAVMAGNVLWECKLWNEALAAAVRARELPPMYYWQVEQGLLIANAERTVFTVSDGTIERTVSMDYYPVKGRAKALISGWRQFGEDRRVYVPVHVLPPVTATPRKELPAVSVQVHGALEVVSNLPRFEEMLRDYIAGINMEPSDDQGFADAEAAVKAMDRAEAALEAAENAALAQTASIEEMRQHVQLCVKLARDTRLRLEKIVKSRKEEIRLDIRTDAQARLGAHIAQLNARLGEALMPIIPADFTEAMKGKKTIAGLRDAVDTVLASAKIVANETAERIEANLTTFRSLAFGFEELFADKRDLVQRDPDYVVLAIEKRIKEHKEKQEARAKAEATATAAPLAALLPKAPVVVLVDRGPGVKPDRPSDDAIIAALALHFRVHESKVIEWLCAMDLDAASKRMAEEFAR